MLLAAGASPTTDAGGGKRAARGPRAANAAGAIEALLSSVAVLDAMPLHVPAATDDVRLARALVASGVDVEGRNGAGETLLEVAARRRRRRRHPCAGRRRRRPADSRPLAARPAVASGGAGQRGRDVVSVLLGHGASSDVLNDRGETPLHAAAAAGAGRSGGRPAGARRRPLGAG